MTPGERNEVRRIATIELELAKERGHVDRCRCDACKLAATVLRYVPSGDAEEALERDRENPSLDAIRSSFEDGDVVMVYGLDDGPLSPADARLLAHALHAAADAAEES